MQAFLMNRKGSVKKVPTELPTAGKFLNAEAVSSTSFTSRMYFGKLLRTTAEGGITTPCPKMVLVKKENSMPVSPTDGTATEYLHSTVNRSYVEITESNLTAGKTYWYRIFSFNEAGEYQTSLDSGDEVSFLKVKPGQRVADLPAGSKVRWMNYGDAWVDSADPDKNTFTSGGSGWLFAKLASPMVNIMNFMDVEPEGKFWAPMEDQPFIRYSRHPNKADLLKAFPTNASRILYDEYGTATSYWLNDTTVDETSYIDYVDTSGQARHLEGLDGMDRGTRFALKFSGFCSAAQTGGYYIING